MRYWLIVWVVVLLTCPLVAQDLETLFQQPPTEASPWFFWYWMQGAVSREGITADLEAIKDIGIEGVYLFAIRDVPDPPLFDPPARQMTPLWWDLVRHSMQEADRLGLQMGMHACDGFSLAGGPWITPDLSMQKVVWTVTHVTGGRAMDQVVAQPETLENYYRDIAVLAFPSPEGAGISTRTVVPKVTTNVPDIDPNFLVVAGNTKRLRSSEPCWILYAFDQPFTCRSINICPDGTSFQPLRLRVEASDDGKTFRPLEQLRPPRHGWQNGNEYYTHRVEPTTFTYAIKPTTARQFRFVYDPAGTEPGSEDLDCAKWKASLKVKRIELFSSARIHQFEGKSGQVWRMSPATTSDQVSEFLCVPKERIRDISKQLDGKGRLQWDVPAGSWTVLRLGHTSTGHRNGTGGGAVGLECDKFNPEVVKLQFDRWFGEVIRQIGPDLARRVLKIFHTDSWEAGSQNWSPVLRAAFKEQRGYDLLPWLPTMAGIPVESAEASEAFLLDLRRTIAELLNEQFFGTLAELAHAQGCQFSAENVAPTMLSDNLRHFGAVDIPMGEFWFRSPTHDKPNDMRDAISGAHIYGKPVVQAEAFTELRFSWDEHPGMLKALGDRNYALGINRLVYHVYTHNPWLDRKPGMSLGPTGIFYQRDQTWFKSSRAWVDYAKRCQVLLQAGHPVVDVAVFTGENLPSRALLPERLASTLPGLFGAEVVEREAKRLANEGQPQAEMPRGVSACVNITNPVDWIDPLHGYAYDSINRDAFLRLAKIDNGCLEMPGGIRYHVLVVPGPRPMSPNAIVAPDTRQRIKECIAGGVSVIMADPIAGTVSAPYEKQTLVSLGIEPDVILRRGHGIAWCHRTMPEADIYFISNQECYEQSVDLSLRASGRLPEMWDAVTGTIKTAGQWRMRAGRTEIPLRLAAQGSIFIVLREKTVETERDTSKNWPEPKVVKTLDGPWQVCFDPNLGGPQAPVVLAVLTDWAQHGDPAIQAYSGTATYQIIFEWPESSDHQELWLDLGEVKNLATVTLNGQTCGTAWTEPYRVNISQALQPGANQLNLAVTNTWANRLITDAKLPEDQRISWTPNPERAGKGPLLPAGLLGPVRLVTKLSR